MSEFTDKMSEMERKAELYDQARESDKSLAEKLQQILQEIEEVKEKIYPTVNILVKERRFRGKMKEKIDEIFNVMKSGTHITREFLEKMYPEEEDKAISNILSALAKLPNVQKVKDGKTIRLFV